MSKYLHIYSASDQRCPKCGAYGPLVRCWLTPDECYECHACGTVFCEDVDDLDRVTSLDLTGYACEIERK
jgi:uncharacterized protein (DUF983 family)